MSLIIGPFDFRAHGHVCRAASEVATLHGVGADTFAIEQGGEISLVDRATLIMFIQQLAGGTDEQVGGGDVGRAGGDGS